MRNRPHTVFFLARSPDAPSTTMHVFSFSSIVLLCSGRCSQLDGHERKQLPGDGELGNT